MIPDPPIWLTQWQARGGERFMSYEQFTAPKRWALAEGRLKLVRAARRRLPVPAFIAEREAICQACEHRDSAAPCKCKLMPVGISKCYKRRPSAVCPADPPRWGPAPNKEK